jgi:hypothetical protein
VRASRGRAEQAAERTGEESDGAWERVRRADSAGERREVEDEEEDMVVLRKERMVSERRSMGREFETYSVRFHKFQTFNEQTR